MKRNTAKEAKPKRTKEVSETSRKASAKNIKIAAATRRTAKRPTYDADVVYSIDELETFLSTKEILFAKGYVKHWNKTKAARDAGYSVRSAGQIGQEALNKPWIAAYINVLKTNIERSLGFSKHSVIEEHLKIAYSSMRHYHNTWIEKTAYELLTDQQKDAIKSIEYRTTKKVIENENGEPELIEIDYVKLELHPKHPHLVEIAKLMGYYEAEKVEQVNIDADYRSMSNEDLKKRVELLKQAPKLGGK